MRGPRLWVVLVWALASAGGADARGQRHRARAPAADEAPPIGRDPLLAVAPAPGGVARARGEALDNAGVLALSQAGLGDAAVAALVRTRPAQYDIATDALIALRRAKVGSGVIAAMIERQTAADAAALRPDSPDPGQPHPPGVYVLAGWLAAPKMLAMKPMTTTRTTTGSILGYAVAGGLIPVSYRAILPTPHATMVAGETRPTFYFYTGAQDGAMKSVWGAAPDPGEISLVQFAATRNGREVPIGKMSFLGGQTGVRARDALPFGVREVAGGVIAVRPEVDLGPGEYGFVQTAAGVGTGAAMVATTATRVFDFAVADAAMASSSGDEGFAREVVPEPPEAGPLRIRLSPARRIKPMLTAAQREAAQPCHYPGGAPRMGCSAP